MGKPRKVPRPFTMPWGGGNVVEEAGADTEHNELVVQLLRYEGDPDSDLDGAEAIRFCQYWLDGRFQRQPLMVSADSIPALREALKQTPRLRELLRQLVVD